MDSIVFKDQVHQDLLELNAVTDFEYPLLSNTCISFGDLQGFRNWSLFKVLQGPEFAQKVCAA